MILVIVIIITQHQKIAQFQQIVESEGRIRGKSVHFLGLLYPPLRILLRLLRLLITHTLFVTL